MSFSSFSLKLEFQFSLVTPIDMRGKNCGLHTAHHLAKIILLALKITKRLIQ